MDLKRLHSQYRELLLDGIAPFWLRHGIDREHGGVLSCMTEDGRIVSDDKYIWSQARSVWTFSALYNRIEQRPEFLEAARGSIRFLLAHGRDSEGRWLFRTTRDGRPLEGATSIYSGCFAVYGFSEYCRGGREPELLAVAGNTLDRIRRRVEETDFTETAPQITLPGHRPHGVPMILSEVANEYGAASGDCGAAEAAVEYASRVLDRFYRPAHGLLVENLDLDYNELPAPEGTLVNPGHAIESMWFVLHVALRHNRPEWIPRACDIIRRHLEAGWDPEYGGIFLAIDAGGGVPCLAHFEKKAWWPHTEALYALLLAHQLTGESWCMDWYERVHEWSFRHFAMPETGEWRQRLDRQGNPVTEVLALPVKDPFHLPRAAILIVQLLGGDKPWA